MTVIIAKRLQFFFNRSRSAKHEQGGSIGEKKKMFLCALCDSVRDIDPENPVNPV